jgi:hypothetical protein
MMKAILNWCSNQGLPILLFVFVLSAYLLTMSGHHYSVDGMAMYQQSKTLLFKGTFEFSPPFTWGKAVMKYIPWPEGLSIVYLIPLSLFGYMIFPNDPAFRTIPTNNATLLNDPSYIYISPTNSIITALTASLLYILATKFGFTRTRAMLLVIVYSFMSPAFVYQKQDFSQPLVALLVVLIVLLFLTIFNQQKQQIQYGYVFIGGLCLGFLVMVRNETMVIVALLCICSLFYRFRHTTLRIKAITSVVLFTPLLGFLIMHTFISNVRRDVIARALTDIFTKNPIDIITLYTGALGNLISPGRGLLMFFPLALFAPYGLYRMYRQRQRQWAMIFGNIVLFHGIVFSIWPIWWGGISWGPRFFVSIVPILALLAFWPPSNTQIRRSHLHSFIMLLKIVAVLVGFIMALGGTLLRWNAHKIQYSPPPEAQTWSMLEQGRWYFKPETNLIWMHWRELGNVSDYDLLLLKKLDQGPASRGLFVFALIFVLFIVTGLFLLVGVRMVLLDERRIPMAAYPKPLTGRGGFEGW